MKLYHLCFWKFCITIDFNNSIIHFIPTIQIFTGTKEYFNNQYFIALSFLKFDFQICYDYNFNYKLTYYIEH